VWGGVAGVLEQAYQKDWGTLSAVQAARKKPWGSTLEGDPGLWKGGEKLTASSMHQG